MADIELRYKKCRSCKTLFLDDSLTKEEIDALYSSDYSPYETATLAPFWNGSDNLSERLRSFYAKVPEAGTLLDYGCGGRRFLDLAKKQGWKTIGADFSDVPLRSVRDGGHESMLISDLRGLGDGSIDRIRMNHVFEHVPDPLAVMSFLLTKLRPGGLVHLAVPNPYGPSARIFRSSWIGLEPRHLVLCGRRPIESLLREAGYQNIEMFAEPTVKDFQRSWLIYRRKLESAAKTPPTNRALARIARPLARAGIGDRTHAFAAR